MTMIIISFPFLSWVAFYEGGKRSEESQVRIALSEGHLLIRSYDDKTVSVNLKFYASKWFHNFDFSSFGKIFLLVLSSDPKVEGQATPSNIFSSNKTKVSSWRVFLTNQINQQIFLFFFWFGLAVTGCRHIKSSNFGSSSKKSFLSPPFVAH